MESVYKVGIIGAGAIVESAHIPVLKVLPSVSIAWVFDRDINRSKLVSDMFDVPVLKNGDVKIALDDIDICLLTIPYGARKEYIELCAQKNKALYVEKPFAISVAEHMQWCQSFPSSALAIGFQRRYYRSTGLIKKITSSAIFGKLLTIDFNQGYFALKGNKPFLSDAALSGGGVIIESAIHTLDQLLLITNTEKVTVNEVKSLQKNGIDYDSFFDTTFYGNGNNIQVKTGVSSLRNLSNGVRFGFEHAVVECNMSPDEQIRVYDNSGKLIKMALDFSDNTENSSRGASSISAAFYYFWSDFVKAISDSAANQTSAVNSLLTTSWIEQIYAKINHTA